MIPLKEITSGAGKFLALLRKAMLGEIWMAAETLVAAIFFLIEQEVVGVVFFVYLISLKLIVSDDSLVGFLPFLLIGLMVLRLYDSYDRFMQLKWVMLVPIVIGLTFHFVVYRKAPHKGRLTKGYLFLSCALALGGLFSLPLAHYFSGTSLYYTYGLGFGIFLLYSLLVRAVNPHGEYDVKEFVAKTAFYEAIYVVFMIAVQYLAHLPEIRTGWAFSLDRLSAMSNNLSTTVLMTMPFLFYLSRKGGARGVVSFALGVLEGLAAIFSLSRGGMIFASAMCVYLIGYTFATDKAGRRRNAITLSVIVVTFVLLGILFRDEINILFGQGIVPAETKVKLIFYALGVFAVAVTGYVQYLYTIKGRVKRRAHLAAVTALVLIALALVTVKHEEFAALAVKADYYRGNMMLIAARNFKIYPFFGTGMGYRGLRVIYENKEGMFGCYHCLPVQIIGSLGLFGVAAYVYMFRERMRALKRGRDPEFSLFVLFSYLGLLWISMVNPGIFCPVVYGLQLAIYFIAAERAEEFKNPEK